ncbi:helix-turn-helix domain-containing protein [Streptosporangium vulgare]|uniref:Helix-turn-helix domain-containing protein n=1 Tax=Streptosporangium vulgare TaxID=46190 RepID=A0ABV5T711_9ACTN
MAVSERHLRDLIRDGIGVPPKRIERIARVRRVLAHGGTHAEPWSHLAATTGYYDQSHMGAEFRTLRGVPPTAFFAGRLPSLRPC